MQEEISEIIDDVIKDQNPWHFNKDDWFYYDGALGDVIRAENDGLYEPPKFYHYLKKILLNEFYNKGELRGIIVIRGPRRVGKTATLKYLIKDLIDIGINTRSLIYLSLDDERLLFDFNRKKILRSVLSEIIYRFREYKPLLIILDEVTFYRGWARALKNLIDEGVISRGVAVIATGSYSLELSSARSELSGRYGTFGEMVGGDVLFYPRRYVEIAESFLKQKGFNNFISIRLGSKAKRLGVLEYLAGYQTEANGRRYGYENKINEIVSKFYDDLHALFKIYMFSGGYPKAFYESIIAQKTYNEPKVGDARYRYDIYDLLVSDSRKFGLDPSIIEKILMNIIYPSFMISKNNNMLENSINIKNFYKYLTYLEASGLFMRLSSITSREDINSKSKIVNTSTKYQKFIVCDPAVFISSYCCSREVTNIHNYMKKMFQKKPELKQLLFEAIVLSHLRYIPLRKPFRNISFISESGNEVTDGVLWYINYKDELIVIPIEVKTNATSNIGKIISTANEIEKQYGLRKLVVVSDSSDFINEENFVVIPIELFLLIF